MFGSDFENWCGWVVSDGGCASHRQCLTVFEIVLAAPLADLSVEWRWGGFSCQRHCLFGAFASSLPAACCLFWYFACQLLVCFDLCQLLVCFDPCQLLAWFETFWEEWSAVGSACLFEWLAISDCSDWKWCLWEAKTKAIWVIGHFAASTHWWKLWRLGGLECLSFNLLVSLSVMQRGVVCCCWRQGGKFFSFENSSVHSSRVGDEACCYWKKLKSNKLIVWILLNAVESKTWCNSLLIHNLHWQPRYSMNGTL